MSEAPPAQASQPPRWRRVLRMLWLVAVAVAIGVALASRWEEVRPQLDQLDEVRLLGGAALALAAVGFTSEIWRTVLAGLGAGLPWRAGIRVFYVGQLGKYLPGSVWPLVAQTELGRDHGVRPRQSFAAVVLFMWTNLCSGAAVAALLLPVAADLPWVVALGALPALALLTPRLLRWALDLGFRILGRDSFAATPGLPAMVRAVGWAAAAWLGFGLHLWAAVGALGLEIGAAAAVGVFAAAWCVGFVFVVAPAGAGVREAVMIALLLPVMTPGAALAVAVSSRLLVTVADVVWGGVGLAAGRRGPDAE